MIFGQCTEHMRSKLEAREDYQTMWENYTVLLLMAHIKVLTYKFDRHNHHSHAIHHTKQDFYHYYHTGHTTNPQYLETFNNKVSSI